MYELRAPEFVKRLMRKALIQTPILIAAAIVMSLSFNSLRGDGIPIIGSWPSSGGSEAAVPPSAEDGDPPFISLDEAAALFQTRGVIFIDARDPEDYALNHIKGAISIPYDYLPEDNLDEFWADLTLKIPNSSQLVIYCSGSECELSLFLGRDMIQRGYTDIKIFYGGWSDWEKAALPTEEGNQIDRMQ